MNIEGLRRRYASTLPPGMLCPLCRQSLKYVGSGYWKCHLTYREAVDPEVVDLIDEYERLQHARARKIG